MSLNALPKINVAAALLQVFKSGSGWTDAGRPSQKPLVMVGPLTEATSSSDILKHTVVRHGGFLVKLRNLPSSLFHCVFVRVV